MYYLTMCYIYIFSIYIYVKFIYFIGHSISLWTNSEGHKNVILFGGRDNDKSRQHVPSTYEVTKYKGTISITQYEGKRLSNLTSTEVRVGLYYNDVWIYNLSCTRTGDHKCSKHSWKQIHPGKNLGGCRVVEQNQRCYYPTERYEHTATIFGHYLYIYGGYSTFCTDYCNDMWKYDLLFDTSVLKNSNGDWEITEERDITINPWTLLENYDVFVLTECSYLQHIAFSQFCRERGKKLIVADTYGAFGRILNDFCRISEIWEAILGWF